MRIGRWLVPTLAVLALLAGPLAGGAPAQSKYDWPLRSPGNARPEQFFFTR